MSTHKTLRRVFIRKSQNIGLCIVTIIACVVTGFLITEAILPVYAKKPDTGSYEFQLQYLDGSLLTDHEWGQFTRGETKEFECRLIYLGNMKADITWKAINAPEGVDLEIWDQSRKKPRLWSENESIMFKPGTSLDLRILFRNVDAQPGTYQDLLLRFQSET